MFLCILDTDRDLVPLGSDRDLVFANAGEQRARTVQRSVYRAKTRVSLVQLLVHPFLMLPAERQRPRRRLPLSSCSAERLPVSSCSIERLPVSSCSAERLRLSSIPV